MIEALRHQILQTEERFTEAEDRRTNRLNNLAALGGEGDWREVDNPDRIMQRLQLLTEGGRDLGVDLTQPHEIVLGDDDLFNPLERIIAENNLLGITFLTQGAHVSRSVGRVVIRDQFGRVLGFGTGFMVSPRLMLTNNHVLETRFSARRSVIQFNFHEVAPGQQSTPVVFGLEPSTFFETDIALDYTLVAVSERNADGRRVRSRGWNPLIPQSGKAVVGERVNIIQHPSGEPLQVAVHDNRIVDVLDNFLHYSTDTQRGSSGSPVFNDQWEVAALHHSGVPRRDNQGRILMINGQPWDGHRDTVGQIAWVSNEGVRISQIVAHLRQRAASFNSARRALFNGIFSPRPPMDESLGIIEEVPSANTASSAARVDENGYAYFTVPLEIRVGLGQSGISIEPSSPVPDSPSDTDETPESPTLIEPSIPINGCTDTTYMNADEDEENRNTYYEGIDPANLNRPTLFRRLNTLLEETHENVLSYREARLEHLYPCVDLHPDLRLRSIYSGQPFDAQELIRRDLEIAAEHEAQLREMMARESFVDQEAVESFLDTLEAQMPFNCEHVVPQSWFNRAQPMKADLHHLFACEPGCNSFRSNIPYFEFPPEDEAFRTECGTRVSNRFEPVAGHGAVARATLYYILRYPRMIRLSDRRVVRERLNVLLGWHEQFPVSDYERHRNANIFRVQGNRNPLIDFPDWAPEIDFRVGLEG